MFILNANVTLNVSKNVKFVATRCRVVSPEISSGIFPEISGKIALFFRNNSAENFRRKFPEISGLTTLVASFISAHSHRGGLPPNLFLASWPPKCTILTAITVVCDMHSKQQLSPNFVNLFPRNPPSLKNCRCSGFQVFVKQKGALSIRVRDYCFLN